MFYVKNIFLKQPLPSVVSLLQQFVFSDQLANARSQAIVCQFHFLRHLKMTSDFWLIICYAQLDLASGKVKIFL